VNNRLTGIFLELAAINAVSLNEKPVADFIRKFLGNLDVQCQEDQAGKISGGNTGNIIAAINIGEHSLPPLALIAHMDTVKPTAGLKTIISDGVIRSDGATILGADNRAGIAVILYLAETIKQNRMHTRPFEIIFTIGEETGLYGSTNLALDLVQARTAYILDSSADPGCYVYSAPSAIDFVIEFHGKASHSAVNPEAGINAMQMAAELIANFRIGKINPETTINFGTIHGGEANNVVPPRVTLSGEIRSFSPSQIDWYYALLQNQLQTICSRFGGSFSISRTESFPGFTLDPEVSALQELDRHLRSHGLEPKPLRYHGASDANILNNRGLMAVDVGIGAKNPHSVDEFIRISDMNKIADIMLSLLRM
jgi:tripeptide aminopeptidase